jgi:CheY-like chemotaxis protein
LIKHKDRILLVDDEQAILDGLCRQHRKHFDMVPACGSAAGIEALEQNGPFAVVVSDYQMPGMNGTQFLAKARHIEPNMARIMLTGEADMQAAIDAVNRGQIFRFLTKPCHPDILRGCIDAGVEQSRLKNAERDLLEQTVRGSVEVLADVLALSNPAAFGKSIRIRGLVAQIVQSLDLEDGWQFETAALLSQIGSVAVPDDLFERISAGESLTPEERAMFDQHPEVASSLVAKIPRLQIVAEMIKRQRPGSLPSDDRVVQLGGAMLSAVLAYDEGLTLGATRKQVLDALSSTPGEYDEEVVEALRTARAPTAACVTQVMFVRELRIGMVIQEDLHNSEGNLIVSKGHCVSEGSLQRLRNYAELDLLEKLQVRVLLPTLGGGNVSSAA